MAQRSINFFPVRFRSFSKTLEGLGIAYGIISFLGFVDALYLTLKYYQGQAPNCSILEGCDVVTSSAYSTIAGIPVALLGVIYYFVIFLFTILYFDLSKEKVLRFAAWLSLGGFVMTLWFLYVQTFILNAYCLYCLISAATSTLLFIFGVAILAFDPSDEES